jgi:hypothetical protein
MDVKRESILNLRKDREVKDTQILETLARIPGYPIKQGLDAYNLEWVKGTLPDRLKQPGLANKSSEANTQYTLDENARKAAMQSNTLQEAIERILTMQLGRKETQQRMSKMTTENDLLKEDLRLRKLNIYPGDPLWMKEVVQWLKTLGGKTIGEGIQKAGQGVMENLFKPGGRSRFKDKGQWFGKQY